MDLQGKPSIRENLQIILRRYGNYAKGVLSMTLESALPNIPEGERKV